MDKKTLVVAGVVALAVTLLVSAFRSTPPVSTVERVVREVVGAQVGPDRLEDARDEGVVTASPPYLATTTNIGTAATLTQADLLKVGYYGVTLGGADEADFTYTLPASTTLTQFVPQVGDKVSVSWFNVSSTTSEHLLIFAAGTGIDLEVASTSATDALAGGIGVEDGDTARILFERQPTLSGTPGNVTAFITLQHDAD